ncbi:MAG: hypothetical protein ABRQ38_11855 [Candidatus Eremiobacterota bacterium]
MNIIQPGQSYNYNFKNPQAEKPDNLRLSVFAHIHTDDTLGGIDKYDGTAKDLDERPGYVKIEEKNYKASMSKEGDTVVEDFEGTGYIMGLSGDCYHDKLKVHVEEKGSKRTEQVTYLKSNLTVNNEMDMETGDVTFNYTKPEPKQALIKPGQPYSYDMNNPPSDKERPDNLYLSSFCHIHTDNTVGDIEKQDGKTEDLDPRPGYVKIENEKYKASMSKEGDTVIKDFEGTGYLMGPSGGMYHDPVKVHMETNGDKTIEEVNYPTHNRTLKNEIAADGKVTFTLFNNGR